jgi:hypothetical protein
VRNLNFTAGGMKFDAAWVGRYSMLDDDIIPYMGEQATRYSVEEPTIDQMPGRPLDLEN